MVEYLAQDATTLPIAYSGSFLYFAIQPRRFLLTATDVEDLYQRCFHVTILLRELAKAGNISILILYFEDDAIGRMVQDVLM